jgi:hypothetical protein
VAHVTHNDRLVAQGAITLVNFRVSTVAHVTHNDRLVAQGAITLNFTGERNGSC